MILKLSKYWQAKVRDVWPLMLIHFTSMHHKLEETLVWQSVLLTIWRQWAEQNTFVEICNIWHCLFQMPYIPWHLQLLSPGTCWTWRHFISRWLILSIWYFHHNYLLLWDIFLHSMWRFWYVQLLLLVISGKLKNAVYSTERLQSQVDTYHPYN